MKSLLPAAVAILAVAATDARGFELPPEVTPEIRQACEADVRRLCIVPTSTVWSVRACVLRKVMQLNTTCRLRLSNAGLIPKVEPTGKAVASTLSP